MTVPSDIEIAQAAKMSPITEIARKLGISDDDLELYGKYKAKVQPQVLKGSRHGATANAPCGQRQKRLCTR